MWGGIFNLAVEGLGKYTAPRLPGIFMMMVVGGGIMPLIQNAIANGAGYMVSYWLVVAMLAYLLLLRHRRMQECQQGHSRRRNI